MKRGLRSAAPSGYDHYMNTSKRTLNTANLVVGQQIVQTLTSSSRWGDTKREVRQSILTVKKVLKNRLVLEDADGKELRFIVEFSAKYPYRNGEVSTDLEGTRGRDRFYSVPRWYRVLWTTDDVELVEFLAGVDAQNKALDVKREAKEALEAFKQSLSIENAEAAILALQQYVAHQKEN
ncbi:hypothetical protein PBI_KIERAN_47 [Microbacterium phage Kieran]|uniref:Uncharacterized protein n=1 Tax=Microbacterium phage Kieran TaxID=2126931 RepID=A0A2R4A2H4_9CAUD|nr:hypothetical protein PBI_KIERAN_47 [Microbacterium phage Kieran]